MNYSSANSIFERINESSCDYFEIESFTTSHQEGDDVLVLKCCWCDASPQNTLFRLRFLGVEYLACATGFHNAKLRVGSDQDDRVLQNMFDFSELSEPRCLFCIETNRPDRNDDPAAHKRFKTDSYYVLALDVEMQQCKDH